MSNERDNGIGGLLAARPDVNGVPAWLKPAREAALARVKTLQPPTTADEEWRFTNITPLWKLPLHPARLAGPAVAPEAIRPFSFGLEGARLVFVDGHYCAALSTITNLKGLTAGSFSSVGQEQRAALEKHLARHAEVESGFFAALNTALFTDGALVAVAPGAIIQEPVRLLYVSTGGEEGVMSHPRNLILAGAGGDVKIVESYVSLGGAAQATNAVTELVLEAGARVEHCRIQEENESGYHIATVQARQARDSRWLSHSVALGARVARNNVNTILGESGAEGVLNGLYLGRGEQLIDHHTVVDHAQPHCESHEYYHGILADKSHGVFNGKIFVRQDAQKTNAKQTNRNLLLSDDASINTKPQLEIFADDVKCTHGATVGQLSAEALFYLRTRCIGEAEARRMLIRAFASDVVERIEIPGVRAKLEETLGRRFAA